MKNSRFNSRFNPSGQNCDISSLEAAIVEDIDGETEQQLVSHLEQCDHCQRQLERIAGEESFWAKATTSLSQQNTQPEVSASASSSIIVKVSDERVDLRPVPASETSSSPVPFDPPTHPEMLGRIDSFSIERMMGRGGMGIVYKGFDAELNRPVAIKFLAPHLAASGVARQRFSREAKAAAAVVHPNVVPIYSIGTNSETPYLVMALVSGPSLQKHVAAHGPLPAEDIVRIAQQIATGLAAAHAQGLVHRDIKPANIMLEKDVSRVLITDFGLARAADDAVLTQSGWLAGTPHYMSPEQTMGNDVDHRSDLFSLGSVMYFMATGREPFRAENPYAVLQKIGAKDPASTQSINSLMPKTLDNLILRLLAKDPADRFDSATSVQEVLTRYLAYLQNPTQHPRPKVKLKTNGKWISKTIAVAATVMPGIYLLLPFVLSFLGEMTEPGKTRFSISTRNNSIPPNEWPTATPAWISDRDSSQQWDAEMAKIWSSIERMEQPLAGNARTVDHFEFEKAELREQIQAMEQSFGIRNY